MEWNENFHDFPEDEYAGRYSRARSFMEKMELDGLMVSETGNYRYFTGHILPTKNRPTVFFLPLDGQPLILAGTYGSAAARQMSWVDQIIEYEVPITWQALQEALVEADLAGKRIGVESHDAFFGAAGMNISYGEFRRLLSEMPDTTFIDASELLWRLRIIKTPAEQECLKTACDITGKAFQHVFKNTHIGMTEIQASRILISAMIENGADFPSQGRWGPCAFLVMDANRPAGQLHAPSQKPLAPGDLLHIDTGAVYNGYCADFARLGTVGEPSPDYIKTWREVRQRLDHSLTLIKAGNRLGDISVHWHGIGLDGVEPPFVGNHDELQMEAGMALALEEIIYLESGETFHLEENVIVSESGYKLLTDIDSDMYLIQ